jgi:hypothetical protein
MGGGVFEAAVAVAMGGISLVTTSADAANAAMVAVTKVESAIVMSRVVSNVLVADAATPVAEATMARDLAVVRGGSDGRATMGAGRATMVLVAMVELATIAMGRLIK